MGYRVGIDVGGTFTDFALYDEATGALTIRKVLSSARDPAIAVLGGLDALTAEAGISAAALTEAIHATTVATNTVIQRHGPKTALLTTKGFRDVLVIGRQKRWELYDNAIDKPMPVVAREHIWEVAGRLLYDGAERTKLDEAGVRRAARAMTAAGIETLAICFLHSYANPAHERRAGQIVREVAPQMRICLSSDVSPVYREYERSSTTTLNAYLMPAVGAYVQRIQQGLAARKFKRKLFIMQSNGGVATPEIVEQFPIRIIESGPAAGVITAVRHADAAGTDNILSFDMGGTTAKLCLIEAGRPSLAAQFEVDTVRLKKNSGLPINISAIDLVEIGSGGGSIARVDMGAIAVGPESAGSNPGPICYGLGGLRPTVTDADLVLGYLDPGYFLGGEMRLDVAAARRGIDEHIGRPLGLDTVAAAWGIHEVVTAAMAEAARVVSVGRGKDPREFAFIPFGGAGPVHGARLARMLGCTRIVFPNGAGVESAIGLLMAEPAFDLARTRIAQLDANTIPTINAIYRELETQGRAQLRACGIRSGGRFRRSADMRLIGQGYEIPVDLPSGRYAGADAGRLRDAFFDAYAATYGDRAFDRDAAVEFVHFRLTASGPIAPVTREALARGDGTAAAALKGHRPVYFPEAGGFVDCPVYDRYKLAAGDRLEGPALIEERESTVVILADSRAEVDGQGNIIVDLALAKDAPRDAVDPVTFSVIWGGLISAAAEMGVTLTRTAFSVAVREGSDFSTGVFNADGYMVAQGDYSPGHLGSMAYCVRRMLEDYPASSLFPGDAIICNDPGIGSGHLPDLYMMCPVFLDDQLLGFAVNIAHQIDIGGSGAGSQTIVGIQDNYQEGLRFMPTRAFHKGEPVRDILRVIESNVRVAEVLGDVRAQYTANMSGARRVEDLARRYGAAVLREAMDRLIAASEAQMRDAIRTLPEGVYAFRDRLDDVGPDTAPVDAAVTVTIGDGKVVVDWTGSGPQREAGLNCYLHYTAAYSIAAVKSVTLPRAPQNEGVNRTIEVKAPPGSFFNATRPAPCGGRAVAAHRIYEVAIGALAKAVPERVIAANSHFFNPNLGGVNPRTGQQFICWESVIGGVGARAGKDGIEATSSPANGTNAPVEVQESRNPVLIERFELIPDSAGAGEFRGGCGVRKDLRILADDVTLYNLGDRHVYAPYGLNGGKSGRLAATLLNPGLRTQRRLHSKGTYRLRANDVISWQTAGAGGMGNPLRRSPEAVLHDVRNGLVSIAGAALDYGVVIDPRRLAVDVVATERRRRRAAAAAKTRAIRARRATATKC